MKKTALVTGAASGNGLSIVTRFLIADYHVIAVDLNGTALEKLRTSTWKKYEKQLLCVQADVSKEKDSKKMINEGVSKFATIDILINNAGITGNADATNVDNTPIEEFDRVFAINVRGVFLACKFLLPHMVKKRSGNIINIASIAGMVAFKERAAYVASKGAVIQLTKSIALDYANQGIRCNALCPGMIETPMVKWRLDQPDLRQAVLSQIPQNEIGKPEQVADAVFYLAGDQSNYFNGAALPMDGGWTAR